MKRFRIGLAVLSLLGGFTINTLTFAQQSKPAKQSVVKITDPKLGIVKYGLETVEYWSAKMKSGDKHRAKKLQADLKKVQQRLGRVQGADKKQVRALMGRISALSKTVASIAGGNTLAEAQQAAGKSPKTTNAMPVTRTKPTTTISTSKTPTTSAAGQSMKPHRDVASVMLLARTLSQRAQDPAAKGRQLKSELATLQQRFQRIPQHAHPDYQVLRTTVVALEKVIAAKNPPVDLTEKQVYALMQHYHKTLPALKWDNELTAVQVDQFVKQMQEFGQSADKDLSRLKAFVKVHQSVTASSLIEFLETGSVEKIQRNMQMFDRQIQSKLQYDGGILAKLSALDAAKNSYAFSNEKKRAADEKRFTALSRTLEQAVRLQKLLGQQPTYAVSKQQVDKNLAAWRAKFSDAAQSRELPKDIGDKALRKIAETVLKNKKYGVGKWERLIVNAKKRPGKRVEHKVFNGSLETIVRVWDEYQVATVEKENGKFYLYYNTLKKFSAAPPATPVGQWILSKRIKSGEIAAARLAK